MHENQSVQNRKYLEHFFQPPIVMNTYLYPLAETKIIFFTNKIMNLECVTVGPLRASNEALFQSSFTNNVSFLILKAK